MKITLISSSFMYKVLFHLLATPYLKKCQVVEIDTDIFPFKFLFKDSNSQNTRIFPPFQLPYILIFHFCFQNNYSYLHSLSGLKRGEKNGFVYPSLFKKNFLASYHLKTTKSLPLFSQPQSLIVGFFPSRRTWIFQQANTPLPQRAF